jgi:hypothetical protein
MKTSPMQRFSAWGSFLIVKIIGFVVKNDVEYHRFPKKYNILSLTINQIFTVK